MSIATAPGSASGPGGDGKDRARGDAGVAGPGAAPDAPPEAAPDAGPIASVIVPTHARPGRLAELLASLARQTLAPERFEVIVVDDGSPEGARPDGALARGNVRLVRQPQSGPAAARNRGAREARAPLLLFVDDDCLVEPDWVAALVGAHAAHPDALLGGTTCNGLPGNACADAAEGLLAFLDAEALARGGALDFVASNDIACARERFFAIGGFDADYPLAAGEDRAFCRAWLDAGGTIRRAPEARVAHRHALDLAGFWRQQRNYGRGAARFHGDGAARVPAPPGFYARLLLHPLGRGDLSAPAKARAFALTALSQLAVASGAFAERRALRREAAARAPKGPPA